MLSWRDASWTFGNVKVVLYSSVFHKQILIKVYFHSQIGITSYHTNTHIIKPMSLTFLINRIKFLPLFGLPQYITTYLSVRHECTILKSHSAFRHLEFSKQKKYNNHLLTQLTFYTTRLNYNFSPPLLSIFTTTRSKSIIDLSYFVKDFIFTLANTPQTPSSFVL